LPIKQWLDNEPEKHSFLTVKSYQNPISIRFLGIGLPGEYLLRLVEEDELSLRNRIRDRFELTDREAEVLMWLSRGKTNRDIGQILSMSPRTVNKHLEQVFKKLGVENRTSAAAVSLQFQSTL
jgi:DNA-binding CsgD family transcriptional regulator